MSKRKALVDWSASLVAGLIGGGTALIMLHLLYPETPGWALWAVGFLTFDTEFRSNRLRDLLR